MRFDLIFAGAMLGLVSYGLIGAMVLQAIMGWAPNPPPRGKGRVVVALWPVVLCAMACVWFENLKGGA